MVKKLNLINKCVSLDAAQKLKLNGHKLPQQYLLLKFS